MAVLLLGEVTNGELNRDATAKAVERFAELGRRRQDRRTPDDTPLHVGMSVEASNRTDERGAAFTLVFPHALIVRDLGGGV